MAAIKKASLNTTSKLVNIILPEIHNNHPPTSAGM